MATAKFTVEIDGVEYKCRRVMEGSRKVTQTVYVDGFGCEDDPDEYGHEQKYQNLSLMEHFARVIARQIIRKAKKSI